MIVDLTRLRNCLDDVINIDITYSFNSDELKGTDIQKLDDVKIEGIIFKDSLDNFNIDLTVNGKMILPCAITLEPTEYPFNTKINGSLSELLEEIDENVKNIENTLDIFPIVWENILLEIPMKVVNEKAKLDTLKGDGWQFVAKEKENTPFEQLKDLLK